VGFGANQFQLNPVAGPLSHVMVEEQRLVGIGLHQIELAVIVKISHANAASVQLVVNTGFSGNLLEGAVPQISKQTFLLVAAPGAIAYIGPVVCVGDVEAGSSNHRQDQRNIAFGSGGTESIDDKKVLPAVIIKIRKFCRPAPARVTGAG